MSFFKFEAFLQNVSFISLFLTMLIFWIQAVFSLDLKEKLFLEKKSKAFEQPINKQYVYSTIENQSDVPKNFHDKKLINGKKTYIARLPLFGILGFFIANLSLSGLLLQRWIFIGYFPLSNLYESLMFLSWAFTFLYLILGKIFFKFLQNSNKQLYLGVIIAPMAFFVNAFAQFSLPKEMQKATSLVPALQSNWLMMHVTVMMLSYAALLIGCVLSIAFLVVSYFQSKAVANKEPFFQDFVISNQKFPNRQPSMPKNFHEQLKFGMAKSFFDNQLVQFSENSISDTISFPEQKNFEKNKKSDLEEKCFDLSASTKNTIFHEKEKKLFLHTSYSNVIQNLDNLSYRILGIGFPLLTLGILSGAVWANEAWGSYWSWDPKETWAFITWLIFATYFHARIAKGWKGKEPAILASLGFFVIWICYLGVNLLGKGLHSYGWISG